MIRYFFSFFSRCRYKQYRWGYFKKSCILFVPITTFCGYSTGIIFSPTTSLTVWWKTMPNHTTHPMGLWLDFHQLEDPGWGIETRNIFRHPFPQEIEEKVFLVICYCMTVLLLLLWCLKIKAQCLTLCWVMNLFHNVKMTIQELAVIITEQEIGEENIEERVEKGRKGRGRKRFKKGKVVLLFSLSLGLSFRLCAFISIFVLPLLIFVSLKNEYLFRIFLMTITMLFVLHIPSWTRQYPLIDKVMLRKECHIVVHERHHR